MTRLAALPARGVIEIAGEDRVAFLNGLVSNDVGQVAPGRAVWAALLSPQGRYLADFFILSEAERLLLDIEQAQQAMLVQALSRYRLRAKVALRAAPELVVHAAWDDEKPPGHGAIVAPDPRLPVAGWRVLAAGVLPASATVDAWDAHRLALGLPDGTRDLEPGKTLLLEAGFDELAGVSWTKGCYMGQELTARTRYRNLVRRRLVPVGVAGTLPAPGTPVLRAGAEVGAMRSGRDAAGLAMLRLEALHEMAAAPLVCGEARLTPRIPGWMRLPEQVG